MNKDLKTFFKNLAIGCLVASAPVIVKEFNELAKKGGHYDL